MKRGPIGMFEMGIYVGVYGKERRYRPTVIYGDGVRRNRNHVVKEANYEVIMMSTYCVIVIL